MRFLPKSRASTDQAPGPTIVKMTPRTACVMAIHGSPVCEKNPEKAIHTLTTAASAPATGVHKPTRRSIPAPTPMICGTTIVNGGASRTPAIPKWMSATAVSSRRSRRPLPGQPSANVENSRCKILPPNRVGDSQRNRNPQKRGRDIPLSGDLQFDNAALQPYRDGMGPVVRAKLGEDVRDVALDGLLCN
jgi:hypothetical protein